MTENTMAAPFEEEGRNRKTMVIAGGAVGALVLAGGGFLLLHGGSSSDESFGPVPHRAPRVKPAGATPNKAPVRTSVKKLPAASAAQIGRDPFAALYIVPAAAAPAGGTGTTTTSSTTIGSTTTTGGTGTSTPGKGTTSTPVVSKTYALKLTKVYGTGAERTAVFSVAGKSQLARVGSVFGRTSELKLLSFQQVAPGKWSVTFQVGDADPTDLAQGEVVSVM